MEAHNNECSIEGCKSKSKRKGMCGKHYQRQIVGMRMTDPAPGFKWCRRCNTDKELSEFNKDRTQCRECEKQKWREAYAKAKGTERHKRYQSISNERNKGFKNRDKHLRRTYNMTHADYLLMYDNQKGKCFICSKHQERLMVDHCHNTRAVRGLLCNNCNLGMGLFDDNIELLQSAIAYLQKHSVLKIA